jgi:hypothetical protein
MKHLFTFSLLLISVFANAQTVCDSVDVLSVQYSPFTDTVIIVEVRNNNQWEIFSYPGFVLLDANDDTVAVETVNYFGIAGESLHALEVRPGMHDPLNNFEGSLELHTNFYDFFACDWDLDQSLCAADPCDSVIIALQNWGGALVVGDFHWRVDDEQGMLVDSGSFTMEAQGQYWSRSLCIPAGNYTYSLTALTDPSGGGPNLTVSASSFFSGPVLSAPLDWFNDPGAQLEFPFFTFCAADPNTISEQEIDAQVSVVRDGGELTLESQETILTTTIFGMDGRLISSFNPNADRFHFPSDLPNGIYLIQVETRKGLSTVKVIN